MNSRVVTIGSALLYVLSVVIGLTWWVIMWRSGFLATAPPFASAIVTGLGLIQVLATVVVLFVLLQCLLSSARAADVMTLVLSGGLLFSSLVWCITPILGAPLFLVVLILAVVRLFFTKRPSTLVQ